MTETPSRLRRWLRWPFRVGVAGFVALNLSTFIMAWSMTHYDAPTTRTTRMAQVSGWDKVKVLFSGPTVRRQRNEKTPADFGMTFTVERFTGAHGLSIEAWLVDGEEGKPVVLLFPGYGASKDTLLRAAQEFHALGCTLWLVDFHGIGGSAGTSTTIGYDEAEDVRAAWEVASEKREGPMIGYGMSMGAAALLRAVSIKAIEPDALILEAPFDRLRTTVGNRLKPLNLPVGPMSAMLIFWGGVQNGFNGFAHNPVEYAHAVHCPTLLMQGENDMNVGRAAFEALTAALGKHGTSLLIPGAGHAFIQNAQPKLWQSTVDQFVARLSVKAASPEGR